MDEEIAIINTNTRNERIKNFFINNKKKLIIFITIIILMIFSYFVYDDYKKKTQIKIADMYNSVTTNFISENKVFPSWKLYVIKYYKYITMCYFMKISNPWNVIWLMN